MENQIGTLKMVGYRIFAICFSFFRIFPVCKNKYFFVGTHDASPEGNIGIVERQLRKRVPDCKIIVLTKKDSIRRPFSFFFGKAYHMATASVIFLDNEFMPMAFTPISSKTKVVQLWHGTGSIKHFGLDAETGEIARLAQKANQRITHLIVSSEYSKEQYAGAFGIPADRIFVTGLPRTDLVLDKEQIHDMKECFYQEYPELRGKELILYAPTFRDDEVASPELYLSLDRFVPDMREDQVLMLRYHPHVADNFSPEILKDHEGKVVDFSHYEGVTTLLAVTDILISDYSSIVFEYALFDRPMIFYAYDYQHFQAISRELYGDYRKDMPGPVVNDQRELQAVLKEEDHDHEKRMAFCKKHYQYMDKKSVERLFELIFE